MNKNKNFGTYNLVLGALLVAMGIVIPSIFHIFGSNAGKIFLPMFMPVIFAGLILPLKYAAIVAVLVPILSNLITGMPPVPMLYFMLADLFAAAISANILSKKINIFVNVFASLAIGKTCYILSLLMATQLFGLKIPFGTPAAILSGLVVAIPGFVCHIVFIPLIHKVYYRRSAHCGV